MMKAKWQVIEEATPEKRIELLLVVHHYHSHKLGTLFANPTPLDKDEFGITDKYVILHTKEWTVIRNSFYCSKEWKAFRQKLILDRGKCERCGSQNRLQIHHKAGYELDTTVLVEGFLDALNYPERFDVICQDCHYKEHKPLIEFEQRLASNGGVNEVNQTKGSYKQ